ncbi:MAG: MarC family protein [Candidatus Omnitrophica bacterium]|nr:MarC family protein [Candidatus Omnitrophota bacterium]
MIQKLLLAFIPIFVAVDAIGVLPIFVSFTRGISKKEKSKVILQSIVTALCLAVGFIFLGKAIFSFLSITVGDFMIAGGLILLCIAIIDIVSPGKKRRIPAKELGSVPLGTPLIVGPAVLTTSLIIIGEYGLYPTLVSVLVNVLLAGLIFSFSGILIRFLGESGSKALSKIMNLFLAAIAIMMMRKGILQILMEINVG